MDREIIKIDESHDIERWRHASASERDRRMRIFPKEMPKGFHLEHKWVDDMTVDIFVAPDVIPDAPTAHPPIAKPEPVLPAKHAAPGSPADLEEKAKVQKNARIQELMKKKKTDLQTIGAELDLDLANSLSPALMASRIADAEEKKAAEAKETVTA